MQLYINATHKIYNYTHRHRIAVQNKFSGYWDYYVFLRKWKGNKDAKETNLSYFYKHVLSTIFLQVWLSRLKQCLKVLSSHSNWGMRLDSFYPMLKSRCPEIKKKNFNDTISREEHKTNQCSLTISKMTLSNQSHFPRFFSPREMTYRDLANSGLRQAGIVCPRKMTLCSWLDQTLFPDLSR